MVIDHFYTFDCNSDKINRMTDGFHKNRIKHYMNVGDVKQPVLWINAAKRSAAFHYRRISAYNIDSPCNQIAPGAGNLS